MRFYNNHLSYCTNIHPYFNVDQLVNVINNQVKAVAHEFSKPFAVGLHLNNKVVNELSESKTKLQLLKNTLTDNNFYVCSLNCFPYGEFHNQVVKEKVYQPDWGSPERTAYTIKAAEILNQLLPDGIAGTISTVPIAYGKTFPENTFKQIRKTCKHLAGLENKITLTFEPEPDCFLDCTNDCIDFWTQLKNDLTDEEYKHIGLCFDTCHFAVVFENIKEAFFKLLNSEINIPKVQISAALKTTNPDNLKAFIEPTYLHQTALKSQNGTVKRFKDLNADIIKKSEFSTKDEWRVHFHVPIHQYDLGDSLYTTADELADFMQIINKMTNIHVEVETYSFSVIRGQKESLTASIIDELNYILEL